MAEILDHNNNQLADTVPPLDQVSPMMRIYLETKAEYKDCLLFYRLGDFYEMFFNDAVVASRELELTLTGKECGMPKRAPMCGIPYHAVDSYLNRLVEKGYKVAIAEQMEDPRFAKGLVKREVIRVVTPGTVLSELALDEKKNNYLMCIVCFDRQFGVSIADISTGDFFVTELDSDRALNDEITRYMPSEIICNEALFMSNINIDDLKNRLHIAVSALDNTVFDEDGSIRLIKEHFHVNTLAGLGLDDFAAGTVAAGAMLSYLYQTQKNTLAQLTTVKPYRCGRFMMLDTATRRNLELTETLREKNKRGSLLWVLDKTRTAMGARMLRSFIEQPLLDKAEILKRQDAIEELCGNFISREELGEYLNPVYDLERLVSRIANKTANPRDLLAFKTSLQMLPSIKTTLSEFSSELMKGIYDDLDPLEDLYELLERSIDEDAPITVREGAIIKDHYSEEVDKLRHARTDGKDWLAELEAKEREKTGIKNLRIKYNKVFGYYLEVTNSFLGQVPDHYIRKQTLTNAERFTTDELKKLEEVIVGAEDRLNTLEYDLFCEVRDTICNEIARIQLSAKAIAGIDCLVSLSRVASDNNYVRPKLNEKGKIDIKNGRHPVVEKMQNDNSFIPNDTLLDNHKNRIAVITGPNMAGKSTYMRQAALIVLMAQIGSFVPADSADISICDRIFTRVGASDDLASGQSTFMVEMTEVANILRNATKNSLLILDEIGRGTSTFDGLSIAWAVIEYISNTKILGAKTLFATHYHELTELEGSLEGVNNYCIAVKEHGEDIIFLRKIVRGGADKSYGIQVARLAGVPEPVIRRANEIVAELSDADVIVKARELAAAGVPKKKAEKKLDEVDLAQMSLFDTVREDDIIKEIRDLQLSNLTPIEALNLLYKFQNQLENRWK